MKKLMVTVAVVAAAVCANAASIGWGSNPDSCALVDASGAFIEDTSYQFVLVCLGTTASYDGVTASDIRGTGEFISEGGLNAIQGDTGISTGAGDDWNKYYAIMAYDGTDLYQLKYQADGSDIALYQPTAWYNQSDKTYDGAFSGSYMINDNFMVAAVPEPTSGLLLLLGVAGLALRRRRA